MLQWNKVCFEGNERTRTALRVAQGPNSGNLVSLPRLRCDPVPSSAELQIDFLLSSDHDRDK